MNAFEDKKSTKLIAFILNGIECNLGDRMANIHLDRLFSLSPSTLSLHFCSTKKVYALSNGLHLDFKVKRYGNTRLVEMKMPNYESSSRTQRRYGVVGWHMHSVQWAIVKRGNDTICLKLVVKLLYGQLQCMECSHGL